MAQRGRGGSSVLAVTGLSKTYTGRRVWHHALRSVSLTVPEGSFFTLLGPSGCGKTTLLRCVAGLEVPDEGEIQIGSRLVASVAKGIFAPPQRRNVGVVFQTYALWPHMTVWHNLAFPLRYRRTALAAAERRQKITTMLEAMGLAGLEDRFPSQLSGGQQQRLAFARALIVDPDLLLLDEPLSNLDARIRVELRYGLREYQRTFGVTTLYVTHDQEEALTLSDHVAVMREGRIVEAGSPKDLYERPSQLFTAEFLGGSNVFTARVLTSPGGSPALGTSFGTLQGIAVPAGTVGGEVTIAIRAEDISVRETPGLGDLTFPAVVDHVEFRGAGGVCHLKVGSGEALRAAGKSGDFLGLSQGSAVVVSFGPSAVSVFPSPA